MVFKNPQFLIHRMFTVWSKQGRSVIHHEDFVCLFVCFASLLTRTCRVWSHLQPIQFSSLTLIFKPFWNLLLVTGLQMDLVISDSACKGEMKWRRLVFFTVTAVGFQMWVEDTTTRHYKQFMQRHISCFVVLNQCLLTWWSFDRSCGC